MEWFFIVLTSFLSLLAPVGLALDQVIATSLRRGVAAVEELIVRVDNRPNWALIDGRLQRVRIASRGLEPLPQLRLAEAELEMDAMALNWAALPPQNLQALRGSLRLPLQGAVRLVVTQEDVNRALAREEIKTRFQALLNRLLPSEAQSLQLNGARLSFLGQNRLEVELTLTQGPEDKEPLNIVISTGLKVNRGHQLELVEPKARLNGRQISSRILNTAVGLIGDRLDLRPLEKQGIVARLLQLQISPQQLQIAAFIRLEPIAGIHDTP
jgi:hypothetical protein